MRNNWSKYALLYCAIMFLFGVVAVAAPLKRLPVPISWPAKPQILKMKLYQGDTIALIWYNLKGDSRCDGAEMIYKEDGYFVSKKISCQQADEKDAYILEPRI